MDYNKRLNKLMKKTCLRQTNKGFLKTSAMIDKSLQELFAFYQKRGYQIKAVVGMREATKMFYEMLPDFPVPLTPYDKEVLVDWDSFQKEDAVLVIGSFKSSRDVERRFWNKNLNCMILNLYDYFYFRGCEVNNDFWEYGHRRVMRKEAYLRHKYFQYGMWHKALNCFSISDKFAHNGIWARTYCLYRACEFLPDTSDMKAVYMQRFIYECVKGRDYITSEKYIRKYIELGFENGERYDFFLREWQSMLEEIRMSIHERSKRDLIVNWIDALSRERMEDCNYLKRLASENIDLKKAYTVLPWTTWSMKTIFMEKKPIEDKLFHYRTITLKNSSLFQEFKKRKYMFRYIGPRLVQRKLFSDRYSGCKEMKESEISSTYYYWKMLCLLAMKKKSLCLWVHELYATHPPYFSPELEYLEIGSGEAAGEDQKKISCQYIDKQIEWFGSFLNDYICQIYMGDHGDTHSVPNYDYLNKRTNIMFTVKNPVRRITQFTKFFSLERMGKLIGYIMDWSESSEEGLYSDYVVVENFDRYEKGRIDRLLEEQKDKYLDYRNWMQFRAIRTEKDLLVRYANGQDWYFLLPDEETNHIADAEYQERIQELRDKLGEGFVDIWKEDFFFHSRRLYQK